MQAKIDEQGEQTGAMKNRIDVLEKDNHMLVFDVAALCAGQLVSHVLGHGRGRRASRACQIAIQNRYNTAHWGRNFVVFMRKNFTTDVTALEDLARSWDAVRGAQIVGADPEMLAEYNERKAVRLISILERSPDRSPIMTWTLDILKNRKAFLSATPCPAPQSV